MEIKMNWIDQIKNTLKNPSMRGYCARWKIIDDGEKWDGSFWEGMKGIEQCVKHCGTGRIALCKYQNTFYQGGELLEDHSDFFYFEIVDNKVILHDYTTEVYKAHDPHSKK